jgi:uncharacterized protein (TIGR00251 family)
MKISDYIKSGTLSVHAKPNSPKTEVVGWDEPKQCLKIAVAAVPDKDRANIELLKFLKKETGMKPELVSGAKSRDKVIRFS